MWNEYKQLHHAFDKDYPSSASNKQPSSQSVKTGIDPTYNAPVSGPLAEAATIKFSGDYRNASRNEAAMCV